MILDHNNNHYNLYHKSQHMISDHTSFIIFTVIFYSLLFFIHCYFFFAFKSHLLHFLFTVIFHSLLFFFAFKLYLFHFLFTVTFHSFSNHIHCYLIFIFIFHSMLLNKFFYIIFFFLFSSFITFLFFHNITVQLSKIVTIMNNKFYSSFYLSEHADKQIFCLIFNASR